MCHSSSLTADPLVGLLMDAAAANVHGYHSRGECLAGAQAAGGS